MELITGRTGTQHVKAIDDAEIHKSIYGDEDYVLPTGGKLNATMSGTNAIIIQNGTAIMQGRQCKIRQSDGQETLEIDSGTAGYKRWDVVCIEYNEADGIESAHLVVIKGAVSSSWQEPTIPYEDGDIDSGETHQMKLWGVKLDGINFDSLVDYREILDTSIKEMAENGPIITGVKSVVFAAADQSGNNIGVLLTANELMEITGLPINELNKCIVYAFDTLAQLNARGPVLCAWAGGPVPATTNFSVTVRFTELASDTSFTHPINYCIIIRK